MVQTKTDTFELGNAFGLTLRAYGQLADVMPYWRTIRQRSAASPFQSGAFQESFLTASRMIAGGTEQKHNPVFVVCFDALRPVAIYPFAIKSGFAIRRLTWLADTLCDYNGAIIDHDYCRSIPDKMLEVIIGRVSDTIASIDCAYLIRNPCGHPTVPDTGLSRLSLIQAEHSAHALSLQRNWKEFYKNLRSKDTRRRFRGKYAALAKSGNLRFSRIRCNDKKIACATQVMDWKATQLHEAGDRNPFGSETAPSHLRATILEGLRNKETGFDLFCLILDGKPVAGILALISGGTFNLWVTAFDPSVSSKYSVGTLLLIKTLEFASRNGLSHFDFLLGDETYKNDWCDIEIPLYHCFQPLTVKGSIYCCLVEGTVVLKKFLLSRPNAMKAIRNARKRVSAFTGLAISHKFRPEPA